ncbi:MAG: hypothetical protein AAF385_08570 [Pseudomonadota bacterium]
MMQASIHRYWLGCLLAAGFCVCVSDAVFAAPGDVLYTDDFERTNIAPWTTTNGTRSGILTGAQVSNSGTRGLFTRHNVVTVTSPTINAAVPGAEVNLWYRRGSDAFSEDPDGGEDLVLEYQRADSSWATLQTYAGGGVNGQVIVDSIMLPPDGLHAGLALRFRQTGGSGSDFDYHHVDDVQVIERAPPPPFGVGTCDDFSGGLAGNWTVASSGGSAGTNSATFQSPSTAMFVNGGVVSVASNPVDTTDPAFDAVSLWVRRGGDAFSENPDGGENLVIEYFTDVGTWVTLETFTGAGTQGQVFLRNYTIPAAGRHSGFQIRFRQTAGSGGSFDFWHVDDVCLDTQDLPELRVSKLTQTVFDPISGTTDPFAIPGSHAEYTIVVNNEGPGVVDSDTLVITDVISALTELFVDTGAGDPVEFIDGAISSGLTYNFAADVTFSEQPGGGPPFTYVPTPDADGFDPLVTAIRIQLGGSMNGATGTDVPSFSIRMRVRVR